MNERTEHPTVLGNQRRTECGTCGTAWPCAALISDKKETTMTSETDRTEVRDRMLHDAIADGNSVKHATDLAVALVEVYDEAKRVAALDGEFPRPSSLVLAKHADLVSRLRPASTR